MAITINGTTGIAGVDGSAATPAVQGGDTNTGIFFPAADTIAFAEGGAEIARFDSSGNLGIGTSSPGAKLDVSGAVRGQQVIATTANPGHAASRALLTYGSNTASLWSYGADSSTLGSISFETRSSNGSLGNTITLFNQYGIGLVSAVPSSGIGITFPATQSASTNANTLDDYEEGTWTPSFSVTSGSATYTTQNGTYTKIGNTVTVVFHIAVNVSSSLVSGGLAGLPFTSSTASEYAGVPFSVYTNAYGGYCNVLGLVIPTSTTIQIRTTASATTAPATGSVSITNGTVIAGSVTYYV